MRRFLKRWQRPRKYKRNKKRRIDNKKALIEFDRIHIKIPVAAVFKFFFNWRENFFHVRNFSSQKSLFNIQKSHCNFWTFLEN